LYLRSLAKPPPLIQRDAQRAARSCACLFVRTGDALHKRASAYKALIRMSSVVLTWIAGKPPMTAHPIPPGRCGESLRDSNGDQLHANYGVVDVVVVSGRGRVARGERESSGARRTWGSRQSGVDLTNFGSECTDFGCGVAHGFWKRCAGVVARLREILRLCWWGRLRKGKGTAEDDLKPSVQSFSNRQSNH
jgi:hypothetical protein